MHLLEVRQTLHDTSAEKDIYDLDKLSKQLIEFVKITDNLSYTDFAYISALASKAKTLLYKTYTIFKVNNEGVNLNNDKQKSNNKVRYN